MSAPRVSVCLPNLNNRAFLQERLETIFAQTFNDWELIIYDNCSEDGAWELFQDAAAHDHRIRLAQAPREGMYANWNNCVRAARGDYIYIATSDDTMAADCLEKLVDALDANPDCDLAHCNLRMFDTHGDELASTWWLKCSVFARSSAELLQQQHVRRAPFDGLLHLLGDTVYTSITQLLIRRSLFSRIGLFEPKWGSLGDFNWNMRAGLVANTVHVPDTWGGWRQHSAQATAAARFGSGEHLAQVDEMVKHAIAVVSDSLAPRLRSVLVRKWEPRMRGMRHLDFAMRTLPNRPARQTYLLGQLLSFSWSAWSHLNSRLSGGPASWESYPRVIASWLESEGFAPVLVPTKTTQPCAAVLR